MEKRENDLREFENKLRKFGELARTAADKPDAFWAGQRARIAARLNPGVWVSGRRQVLIWAPAAIVIMLSLFWFAPESKVPNPDFAAGYDQNLLIEIEQALKQNSPEALAPAGLITREIEVAAKSE